jgi:hypothetical protein
MGFNNSYYGVLCCIAIVGNKIVGNDINPAINHLINSNLNNSDLFLSSLVEINNVDQNSFNYLMPMNNPGLLHSMNETNYNEHINNSNLDEILNKSNDLPIPDPEYGKKTEYDEKPEDGKKTEYDEEPEDSKKTEYDEDSEDGKKTEYDEDSEYDEEPDSSKRSLNIAIETSIKKTKKAQKDFKLWCFVGDFKGERGCAPVGNRDKCITGQMYVDQMECLKIKPDNAPILPSLYSNYYN